MSVVTLSSFGLSSMDAGLTHNKKYLKKMNRNLIHFGTFKFREMKKWREILPVIHFAFVRFFFFEFDNENRVRLTMQSNVHLVGAEVFEGMLVLKRNESKLTRFVVKIKKLF